MKTFELPNGENKYGFLDMETGYDYHEKRLIPETRSYIREDGGHAINGCICKTLYDLDTISMLYVSIEPGVSSPAQNFIRHTGREEITLVTAGSGTLEFPNGEKIELKTDVSFYLQAGQPHRIVNDSLEVLKYVTVYSGTLQDIPRESFTAGGQCSVERGYEVKNINDSVQKMAPGFSGKAPDAGHFTSIIFEGDNLCFLHPIQYPENSSPMEDFVSHPGVHELEFAISGKAVTIMPDRAYHLRPGIMRYNPPEQPSKTWNNSDEELRLAVFYSTGKLKNVFRTRKHARIFEILD